MPNSTPPTRDSLLDHDLSKQSQFDIPSIRMRFRNPISASIRDLVALVLIVILLGAVDNGAADHPISWVLIGIPLAILYFICCFRTGAVVNFRRGRYRRFAGPWPWRPGLWQNIGIIEGVVIRDYKTRSGGGFLMMTSGHSTLKSCILLAREHTDQLLQIAVYASPEAALNFAQTLAQQLRVPCEDERLAPADRL